MPLHAISLELKYAFVFGTIGPVKEEWGDAITQYIDSFWKGRAVLSYNRLKFEVSNTGYPHFHLALQFTDRQRYGMFVRHLQNFLGKQFKHDKPAGYGREKQFSVRLFNVPCTEVVNGKQLRGVALVDHYLDNPTKEKSTDGQNYSIEFDGLNVAEEIRDWRTDAQHLENRDPKSLFYKSDCELAALKRAASDAMEAYAKAYARRQRYTDLPPLDKFLLHNRPSIDRVAEMWKIQQGKK